MAIFGLALVPLTAGVVEFRCGDRRPALSAFGLGLVGIGIWLPYDFGLEAAQVGYGAAELVTLGAYTMWALWTAHCLATGPRADLRKSVSDGGLTEG